MPSTWGGSGGWNGESSIGGVSAVNPQAQGNYQQYQDAAFANAKQRLDPILQQQRDAYAQQMVNMGLPVGGEAYNKAFQQLDQNQNDAWSNASFGAMKFGADMQNQDFTQDLARSDLANALLRSRWDTDLGYYNTDTNKAIADMENAFKYANLGELGRQFDLGLGEEGRQFDQNLGYNYDLLGQRGYEFDAGLGQRAYEFDSGLLNDLYQFDSTLGENARQFDNTLGYNYWDQGNRYDYMWDRAAQDDLRFATGEDRQDYYDRQNASRYDDALLMQLFGFGGTPGVYTQDPSSAYNAQMSNLTNQQNNSYDFLAGLFGGF